MLNTLHVLPAGEYKIIKKTKYGIWVQIGTSKVFINYSETFTDPDKLIDTDNKN
jgi:DNA-directed RNA polymerase subunit E'/Rpb7